MTTELTLTQDQENAIAAFASFMLSDDKEMVISGPAGVGKTTMLRFLLERRPHEALAQTLGTKVPSNWIFTATTNKAADVLARSMNRIAEPSIPRWGCVSSRTRIPVEPRSSVLTKVRSSIIPS